MLRSETEESLTLAEAIEKLRIQTGEVDMTDDMSPHSAKAFLMHDAAHVVFGCDESLPGEISAHAWMALATTAPLAEMHRAVASREHRNVLSGIGHLRLLTTWLRMIPRLLAILIRSRRMKARLSYDDLPSLMTKTVETIRSEYRISPL